MKPLFEPSIKEGTACEQVAADFTLQLLNIFDNHIKVNYWDDDDEQNRTIDDIEDFLYDEIEGNRGIDLSAEQMDKIIERSMQLARHRKLV